MVGVNVVLGALILVGVTAFAVAAMLFVRRGAPEGSYFADGDRASGVFGVLATGFAVLLGFVVFLSFTSYDAARAGAETEALVVAQQVETAQFFDPATAQELTVGLVCYARSVAGVQWQRMEDHTIGDTLNPWAVKLFAEVKAIVPASDTQQSAYDRWMDQTSQREQARNDRIHGAVGVIPTTLWLVLFFTAVLIFAYVLFFADSGERPLVQAMLMGSVVAVIVAMFLLLYALDHPFHHGLGGLRPVAMERTLRVIDEQLATVGIHDVSACDAAGNPS
jgi:succinate dehydrogenase/fumarate reductase cytochrome b subunit